MATIVEIPYREGVLHRTPSVNLRSVCRCPCHNINEVWCWTCMLNHFDHTPLVD
jgi:hypothetical protein